MKKVLGWRLVGHWALGLLFACAAAVAEESVPSMYALEFLAPASEGVDINEQGQVLGNRAIDTGCDPSCVIVPEEPGVWSGVDFAALPTDPDWVVVFPRAINANGWVVGTAGTFSDNLAILWRPSGDSYDIVDLGTFADTDHSEAVGIDDSNRVVGFSYRLSPALYKAFQWTEQDGMVEMTSLGFPSDSPLAISPGGTVAYLYGWYQLDVPGVVHENTSPPDGFRGPGAYVTINDAGDQLRLVAPTNGANINYPFRYHNTGEWQQIFPSGGIDASPFGVGSITTGLDISLTISATGLIAPGPAEEAQLLTDRLSPAYGDATAYEAGPLTEAGSMVGQTSIGDAPRLVRFIEAQPCSANCLRVRRTFLRAEFVEDPNDPGRCVGTAHTRAMARVQVTDERGRPMEGVEVTGHFLTSYRLNDVRTGVTDSRGILSFRYRGAPCTGTMTFLVNDLARPGHTFDRTTGELQSNVIPAAAPDRE